MRFSFYPQADSMDCGPACLRMVAIHYGKAVSLQALREKTEIGKGGVNLLGISEAAEAIGFRAHPLKLTADTLLRDAQLPAIVHWDQHHFIVVYRARRGKVYVADPARGLVTYSREEFEAHWISDRVNGTDQGIALLLEPTRALADHTAEEPAAAPKFKNVFTYLLPHKALVLQLLLGLCVGSLLQLCLPFLTQSVVDTGVNTANIHFVYIVLFAQLALLAGRLVVEFVRGWILLHISTRINVSILAEFLIKLMKLPVGFFDSKHLGDIMQRMSDHRRIEAFLTGSSLNVIFSLFNLVVFSVVLLIYNGTIFTVFAIGSTVYAGWILVFLRYRRSVDHRRFAVASKEQSFLIQLVQGMQEIKLYGAERAMRSLWEGFQAALFRVSMQTISVMQWQQSGAFVLNEGKNVFITFLAAKAVIDGHMTLGAMLAVQYIIGQLNSPIEQLVSFSQSVQDAKISMDRLNEIHTMADEEPAHLRLQPVLSTTFQRQIVGGMPVGATAMGDIPIAVSWSSTPAAPVAAPVVVPVTRSADTSIAMPEMEARAIRLDRVSFTYPGAGNERVLRDISLDIPFGKTTAVVGMSGSGKTTLLKLLLRFYDPQSGELMLGEAPARTISHRSLRSRCGVVMQDSFIFADTIAKNIAIGEDRIDLERLRYAANVANIREFIDGLPLGFNTTIGVEGLGLSMGQRQRVLIARAVYRNPDVILFDEATNSLDANNESIILRNLDSFFAGRTVVVVAHRLSTVKHADQIVVLNRGIITERGTHQELHQLRGEYYQLIKNQLELGA